MCLFFSLCFFFLSWLSLLTTQGANRPESIDLWTHSLMCT
jgi:hypothetical protein